MPSKGVPETRTLPARSLLDIMNMLNAARRINGDEPLSTIEAVMTLGHPSASISAAAEAGKMLEIGRSACAALKTAFRGIADTLEYGEMDPPSVAKARNYEAFIANDCTNLAPNRFDDAKPAADKAGDTVVVCPNFGRSRRPAQRL